MADAAAARRVPAEQRIFSLVLALVVAPEGLTRDALLSSVYGYAHRFERDRRSIALERQFERDKEQLRALGIPIETLDSPQEPGNNQLTRYRISKERFEFPSGLEFSERELMLLRLAAYAWRDGSLSAESRRAVMKLEALGAGLDVRQLGIAPRLGAAEPAAPKLRQAIDAGVVVRFGYTLPERSDPLARRVAPLGLHRAEGRWHLIAWDLDRDAGRVFLLSRISEPIVVTDEPFPPGLRAHADGLVAGLLRRRELVRVELAVERGSAAEARLSHRADRRRGDGDAIRLELGTLDLHVLAEELAAYGPDAVVVSPPELRDLVVARLRAMAEAHEEAR